VQGFGREGVLTGKSRIPAVPYGISPSKSTFFIKMTHGVCAHDVSCARVSQVRGTQRYVRKCAIFVFVGSYKPSLRCTCVSDFRPQGTKRGAMIVYSFSQIFTGARAAMRCLQHF
jgi:hypothetical protein